MLVQSSKCPINDACIGILAHFFAQRGTKLCGFSSVCVHLHGSTAQLTLQTKQKEQACSSSRSANPLLRTAQSLDTSYSWSTVGKRPTVLYAFCKTVVYGQLQIAILRLFANVHMQVHCSERCLTQYLFTIFFWLINVRANALAKANWLGSKKETQGHF